MDSTILSWRRAGGVAASYAILQVLVGFQVAFLAVGMHLKLGWSLSAALAAAIPLGLPLVLIQGSIGWLWWRSREVAGAPVN